MRITILVLITNARSHSDADGLTYTCIFAPNFFNRFAGGGVASASPSYADEIGGSALRVLHQLAGTAAGAEAVARAAPPAAPVLAGAMGWGVAGTALSLETLKRALGLGVPSRDALVGSALRCGLVEMLLARLDWRTSGSGPTNEQVCSSSPALIFEFGTWTGRICQLSTLTIFEEG
jgi:hypothetical protein